MPDTIYETLQNAVPPANSDAVRPCSACGNANYYIQKKDNDVVCCSCGEPFRFFDQPENWKSYDPQDDIDQRLMMRRELFPFTISLGLDQEGRDYLAPVLAQCRGKLQITDNGGGELTDLHWQTVIQHVGYGEIMVWSTDPGDIELIRNACIPDPDETEATAKENTELLGQLKRQYPQCHQFYINKESINDLLERFSVADGNSYFLIGNGRVVEDYYHMQRLAEGSGIISIDLRHNTDAIMLYKWLHHHNQKLDGDLTKKGDIQ